MFCERLRYREGRDHSVSLELGMCSEAENSVRFSAWFHSLLPIVNGRDMFVIVVHNRLLENASPVANYSILIAALLGNRHNTLLTDNLRLCANMCVSPWLCAWVPSISSLGKHIRWFHYRTIFVIMASSPFIFLMYWWHWWWRWHQTEFKSSGVSW